MWIFQKLRRNSLVTSSGGSAMSGFLADLRGAVLLDLIPINTCALPLTMEIRPRLDRAYFSI
jgi:hypothetical protein